MFRKKNNLKFLVPRFAVLYLCLYSKQEKKIKNLKRKLENIGKGPN